MQHQATDGGHSALHDSLASCGSALLQRSFPNATLMTTAVVLECAKFGKGVRSTKQRSSTYYVYACLDSRCSWTLKAGVVGRSNPHASAKHYVIKEVGHHVSFCSSVPKMMSRHLEESTTLQSIISNNPAISGQGLLDSYRVATGVSLDSMPGSSFYRLRNSLITTTGTSHGDDYACLPQLFASFCLLNKSSTAAIQLDLQGRFLRSFLSPSVASHATQSPAMMKILMLDATHSKTSSYNGIHLQMVAKDGNGDNTLLAIAFVPKENVSNMAWFIQMCIAAGLPVTEWPLFCDRGHLLAAAAHLKQKLKIGLNLKYCVIHIIRNIMAKFKISNRHDESKLRNLVHKMQMAKTFSQYNRVLGQLTESWNSDLRLYIIGIEPLHWCVFANRQLVAFVDDDQQSEYDKFLEHRASPEWVFGIEDGNISELEEDEASFIQEMVATYNEKKFFATNVPIGWPAQLYGISDTNAVEGENFASLASGARHKSPYHAMLVYMRRIESTYRAKRSKALVLLSKPKQQHSLLIGDAVWEEASKEAESRQTTRKVLPSGDSIVYVSSPSMNGPCGTRVLVTDDGVYCTCCDATQLGLPCVHFVATIREMRGKWERDEINYTTFVRNSYDDYLLTENFIWAFKDAHIILPSEEECQKSPSDILVQKPPRYTQPQKRGRPISNRFRSTGETGNKGRTYRKKKGTEKVASAAASFQQPKSLTKKVRMALLEVAANRLANTSTSSTQNAFLLPEDRTNQQTSAAPEREQRSELSVDNDGQSSEKKKKGQYKCSLCRKPGHNVTSCPKRASIGTHYVKPEDIKPGKYACFSTPHACSHPEEITAGRTHQIEGEEQVGTEPQRSGGQVPGLACDFEINEMQRLENSTYAFPTANEDAETEEDTPEILDNDEIAGHDSGRLDGVTGDGTVRSSTHPASSESMAAAPACSSTRPASSSANESMTEAPETFCRRTGDRSATSDTSTMEADNDTIRHPSSAATSTTAAANTESGTPVVYSYYCVYGGETGVPKFGKEFVEDIRDTVRSRTGTNDAGPSVIPPTALVPREFFYTSPVDERITQIKFIATKWKMEDNHRQAYVVRHLAFYDRMANSAESKTWYAGNFAEVVMEEANQNREFLKIAPSRPELACIDLRSLLPGIWIRDPVINFYMALLNQREIMWSDDEPSDQWAVPLRPSHFLDTWFYSTILNGVGTSLSQNYEQVARWFTPKFLFSLEYLIAPVNENNTHWQLVVVHVRKKIIYSWDPYHYPSRFGMMMKEFIRVFHCRNNLPYNSDEWLVFNVPPSGTPRQTGTTDCGVFICMYANLLSSGRNLNHFGMDDILDCRRSIACAIKPFLG